MGPRLGRLLDRPALTALFNDAFSDYLVPMRLDEEAFAGHVEINDIDLSASPVAFDGDRPVALALVAIRGDDAWIGGMGTVPSERRRGLGEAVLVAGLDAARERGCRTAWLEVIDRNDPAVRLYERLGFQRERDVIVWSLDGRDDASAPARTPTVDDAHEWIAGHRPSREPWQRTDAALAGMRERRPLRALAVDRDGAIAAAMIHDDTPTVMQIAALDEAAATDLLRGRGMRMSNAPAGEPASRALEGLGARMVARQHEMRIAL
jgi:ribosomal protein S18 acetylase RimI-like enzyme